MRTLFPLTPLPKERIYLMKLVYKGGSKKELHNEVSREVGKMVGRGVGKLVGRGVGKIVGRRVGKIVGRAESA